MFDFVRNNQKLMQFLLLLFIAPAFVLLGVNRYEGSGSGPNVLATVGDYKITQAEFDQVKRNRIEEARQRAGANFDPKQFDNPQVNKQLLDTIISEYLLQKDVAKEYLTASDEALRTAILETPAFQKDGKFDMDTYKALLAARGLTPASYDANLRFNMARDQVLNPLFESVFFTKSLRSQIDNAQLAGRVVQTRTIGLDAYLPKVSVTDDEITKYYNDNKSAFETPATADVQYLVLSPADIKAGIEVSDADVQSYYEQNKARFSTPEQRKVRHILLPAEEQGKTPAELKAAAEKVLAEVKANPADFAKLAAKYSSDAGSAKNGGDLGYFGKGDMPAAFEQAMFALKKDQISDLVKTQFGYHILEVTDIRGGDQKPLADVKSEIVSEIKNQKLTVAFASAQETFSEKVYEGGQSFDAVAKQLKLTPVDFKGLTRQPAKDTPKVLADPKVLDELFSDESIKSKNNTKAIQVGDSLVSAHIVSYQAAAPKPLAAVKDTILKQLKQQKAAELASKDADALVAQLNDAKADSASRQAALKDFDAAKTISAIGAKGVPGPVAQAVLDTGASKLPKALVVPQGDKGFTVAWVSAVADAEVVKKDADPQVLNFYNGIADQSYQEALALAAREVLAKRIGVEIKKQF
ncbi:SurA N-terminal domain-containing protein [Limnobacter sp.]|uniref:SurA N-terminal domain-containing protein n=1 Tax=Limnobacter sp. TaxID=2003368 RepID=UPI00258C354B|nr:SurA N-terminal domain-containing protein [Limnobacter sp.]